MRRSSTAWGSHCLGNEWLVIPSCSSGVPFSSSQVPNACLRIQTSFEIMDQALWWEQVFTCCLKSLYLGISAESKPHSTVDPPRWVGLPCIPRCHDYIATFWCCSMPRGSCMVTGCASVSLWSCRSLSTLLQVQSPAHTSLTWMGMGIHGGQWCPGGGGWQHCQSQQTLSNCSFSAASSAPQIEVIVPGVRSIKLNSPKFNQFDKQWYSKATAAASKSHFSSLLRDLLWGAASQCHPSSSGDTVRGKAQDWIYLSSSSLDSGQRYHSSEKPSQPLHIANNGSWWGTAGSAHFWDSCEWRGHLSLTSCFNLKGRLGKWYKNEQGEASYACFAHFAVKCRNTQNKFNGRNSDWRLCVLSAGYNAIISLCAFVCAGEHEGAPAISASPKDHLRIQSTSIFLFFFFLVILVFKYHLIESFLFIAYPTYKPVHVCRTQFCISWLPKSPLWCWDACGRSDNGMHIQG